MPGGRDCQRGDIHGDRDEENPGTFDVSLEDTVRRETEDETKEECLAATVVPKTEGKPLVLLQINCRSIYNKTLDFWNLIDTYNPAVKRHRVIA